MEEKVMDQPKEFAVGGDEAHVEPVLTNAEGRCHGQTGTDGEENDSGLDGLKQEEKGLKHGDIIGAP
jgi:hypothetical protein